MQLLPLMRRCCPLLLFNNHQSHHYSPLTHRTVLSLRNLYGVTWSKNRGSGNNRSLIFAGGPQDYRTFITGFDRKVLRNSGRKNNSNRSMVGIEDDGEAVSNSEPQCTPPLIDIDCNLLHVDMIDLSLNGLVVVDDNDDEKVASVINDKDGSDGKSGDRDDDFLSSSSSRNILNILNHESTIRSNIVGVFSPSSTMEESRKSFEIFVDDQQEHNLAAGTSCNIEIRTSVGVHPYHAEEEGNPLEHMKSSSPAKTENVDDEWNNHKNKSSTKIETLSEWLKRGKEKGIISCVGEIGLDYSKGFPSREHQIPWFHEQLNLAYHHNLSVFLHERLAFHDVVQSMEDFSAGYYNKNKGHRESKNKKFPKTIVHCFTGTIDECKKYVGMGFYIGLTGYIIKSGDGPNETRQCLVRGLIPLDRLMIETDAPYMGFPGCRDSYLSHSPDKEALMKLNSKKRKRIVKGIYPNVPSSLSMILESVADAINEGRMERQEDLVTQDEVGRACTRNAIDFFGFSPRPLQ